MIRFLLKLLAMVLPIICTIIYYTTTVEPHRNGDLGRLGLLPFDDDYDNYLYSMVTQNSYETRRDNLDFEKAECDSAILVIGDSFSDQGNAGFVNYLGEFYPGYKIYNFRTDEDNLIRYQLFINRLIEDKPLPQIVIFESVERYVTSTLSQLSLELRPEFEKINKQASTHDISPSLAANSEEGEFYKLVKSIKESKEALEGKILDTQEFIKMQLGITSVAEKDTPQNLFMCKKKVKRSKFKKFSKFVKNIGKEKDDLKQSFLNTQEYVKKRWNILKDNPVIHVPLKKDLFSCKGAENDLYFYFEDIQPVEKEKYRIAKQNLESLIAFTKQKGKNFLFMVPSDKFDLYKDFTKKNKYKKIKCPLDYYREFNSNDRFLNCKELLYPHVKNGEKDIYRCHDTHWSPIAARYVAEEIKRKIDNQK